MIVFNGFNIAEENTPRALRWIPKVSFIRWCSEGLAVNEFSGLRFSCKGARGPCCETGEQALERVSFGGSTVRGAAVAQAKLVGGLYVATLLVLRRSSPRFLRVEPPLGAPAAAAPPAAGELRSVAWTAGAEASLQRVPFFVRGFARKRTEDYARGLADEGEGHDAGDILVTEEILLAAKEKQSSSGE